MEREYIGVDLHKEFLQACAVTSSGTRVWEGRFQPMSVVMINEHREGTQGDACWRSAANRGTRSEPTARIVPRCRSPAALESACAQYECLRPETPHRNFV